MNQKKSIKVLWLSDVPGWAYNNNAMALASNLPQFEHKHINYCVENVYETDLEDHDIIVVSHPAMLKSNKKHIKKSALRFGTRLFKIMGNGTE